MVVAGYGKGREGDEEKKGGDQVMGKGRRGHER